nr:uncharacterized protein LOC127295944 [Lolium perenne]XP_051181936.1 uncharacterized protein LOC127295945 [Lolium perenne]
MDDVNCSVSALPAPSLGTSANRFVRSYAELACGHVVDDRRPVCTFASTPGGRHCMRTSPTEPRSLRRILQRRPPSSSTTADMNATDEEDEDHLEDFEEKVQGHIANQDLVEFDK